MCRPGNVLKIKNKRRPRRADGVDLRIPIHLAVIMDGNGRWAGKRGLPRTAGHRAGAENLENICKACIEQGIQYLTVYAFSTENWSRPAEEVDTLMDLFIEFIHRFDTKMAREGIRLRFAGDLAGLPSRLQSIIARAEETSRHRDRLQLIIAINYGGRRELAQACRKLAEQVQSGQIEPGSIDENLIRSVLYLSDVPDPDLIIRPSGEQRLSNFLIWQSAYSEFWFSDVLWPDFDRKHLLAALKAYTLRDRRFGGVKQI